jgi:hypothetical protein
MISSTGRTETNRALIQPPQERSGDGFADHRTKERSHTEDVGKSRRGSLLFLLLTKLKQPGLQLLDLTASAKFRLTHPLSEALEGLNPACSLHGDSRKHENMTGFRLRFFEIGRRLVLLYVRRRQAGVPPERRSSPLSSGVFGPKGRRGLREPLFCFPA